MKRALLPLAMTAGVLLTTAGANAELAIKQGDWTIYFTDKNSLGVPQCSLATTPGAKSAVIFKYSTDDRLFLNVYHKDFKLAAGSTLQIMLGFDGRYITSNNAVALEGLDGVGFAFNAEDFIKLQDGMRGGTVMWLGFKGSNTPPWKISTTGLNVSSKQFDMCVSALYAGVKLAPPPSAADAVPYSPQQPAKAGVDRDRL